MAFKRSAVRSRLSPPQKRTSGRMSFFVVKVGLGRTAVRTQGFLLHSKSAAARRSAVRRTNPQCHGGAKPRSIPLISTTKKDIRKDVLFCGKGRFGENRRSNTRISFAQQKRRSASVRCQADKSAVSRRGEAPEYPAYLHHKKGHPEGRHFVRKLSPFGFCNQPE